MENRKRQIAELADRLYQCEARYNRVAMTNIFGKEEEENKKIHQEYVAAQAEMLDAKSALRKAQNSISKQKK